MKLIVDTLVNPYRVRSRNHLQRVHVVYIVLSFGAWIACRDQSNSQLSLDHSNLSARRAARDDDDSHLPIDVREVTGTQKDRTCFATDARRGARLSSSSSDVAASPLPCQQVSFMSYIILCNQPTSRHARLRNSQEVTSGTELNGQTFSTEESLFDGDSIAGDDGRFLCTVVLEYSPFNSRMVEYLNSAHHLCRVPHPQTKDWASMTTPSTQGGLT